MNFSNVLLIISYVLGISTLLLIVLRDRRRIANEMEEFRYELKMELAAIQKEIHAINNHLANIESRKEMVSYQNVLKD